MLTAKDIMTPQPLTVTPETDIAQAAAMLLQNDINGLPVIDQDGHLVGILCQSDLVSLQKKFPLPSVFTFLDGFLPLSSMSTMEKEIQKIFASTVADAMTPSPVTVKVETPVDEIAGLMVDRKFHSLPVMDGDKLVGMVGMKDILKTVVS
ncbi:CBS domain-containing protein [Desulfoplanes formicivorans]|uniref:Membrane protein n=1 Tax=Desulfoplanes formicivorans TaxID=1592317 RepID=A0A194AFT7_9BACT|nr:CBS domain-containing protein [Desulfoplanes formicivorans]GAU08947.1 membrane protein [Desulfoplanes formicivorans]